MKRRISARNPFRDIAQFPVPLSPRDAARRLLLHWASMSGRVCRPDLAEAPEKCDWDYFLSLCARHGLAPLVHVRLEEALAGCELSRESVPGGVQQALARYHATNLARNVFLLEETASVCKRLQALGVPVMLLKGMALLDSVYPHPALRPMTDVDMLVDKKHLASVRRILATEFGYLDGGYESAAAERLYGRTTVRKRGAPSHLGQVLLELHWSVAPMEYVWKGRSSPVRSLWSAARPMAGDFGGALKPNDADHLSYLALHNSIHCFDRIIGLVDVGRLLLTMLNPMDIMTRATLCGCRHEVFLNLALAQAMLGVPLESQTICALTPPPWRGKVLAGIVSREVLFEGGFSTRRRALTQLLCGERLGDALRLLFWVLFPPKGWLEVRRALAGVPGERRTKIPGSADLLIG